MDLSCTRDPSPQGVRRVFENVREGREVGGYGRGEEKGDLQLYRRVTTSLLLRVGLFLKTR